MTNFSASPESFLIVMVMCFFATGTLTSDVANYVTLNISEQTDDPEH